MLNKLSGPPMCARYTLTYKDLAEVAELVESLVEPSAEGIYRPRFNLAPSQAAVIITGRTPGPTLVAGRWGFSHQGRLVFNLRAETLAQRFPEALARGRILVPADGFYEWSGPANDRKPTYFRAKSGGVLLMAGVAVEPPREGRGTPGPPAFATLTTAAYPPVDAVHDRAPVLLTKDSALEWLARPPGSPLVSNDVGLASSPVSSYANSAAHDDPQCLAPREASPQLSLFR